MNTFVSFSGGADSLAALLYMLNGPELIQAVHFEHGIRGKTSLEDMTFCVQTCQRLNVPLQVISLDVPHHRLSGESLEDAARRLRLEEWRRIADKTPDLTVILGHHVEDAVETMLMRLCRGCNVTGLTALRKERVINGIRFIRPLLDWTRPQIENFLKANGFEKWCSDPTNYETEYFRNYIRNSMLPALYQQEAYAEGGIRKAYEALLDDADYLEKSADSAYELCKDGNLSEWRKLHSALFPRVLRRFLAQHGIMDPPAGAIVNRTKEMIRSYSVNNGELRRIPLGNNRGFLTFHRNCLGIKDDCQTEIPQPVFWDILKKNNLVFSQIRIETCVLPRSEVHKFEKNTAYFDDELLPKNLILDIKRDGDTMLLFNGHHRSLKKMMCDAHIASSEHAHFPVLKTMDGIILFVPGLRASAEYKISEQTRYVRVFRYEHI